MDRATSPTGTRTIGNYTKRTVLKAPTSPRSPSSPTIRCPIPGSTFREWLAREQGKKRHITGSAGPSTAGLLEDLNKLILDFQSQDLSPALLATNLETEVAELACDLHKGLSWHSEVDNHGNKTGLKGLVYTLDPSAPHCQTCASLKKLMELGILEVTGFDRSFYVKDCQTRRTVVEDLVRGKEADFQIYGRGQNIEDTADGFGITGQVAFLNETHKYLIEESFFAVAGTRSTQVAVGVRVHALKDRQGTYSPIQYFIFAISWLRSRDSFVFHGGVFFGADSDCNQPGLEDYQVHFKVDPVVYNTSKEAFCGHWAVFDLHTLDQEASEEIHTITKGPSKAILHTPDLWKADCLQAARQAVSERGMLLQCDVEQEDMHELLVYMQRSDL